jgi:hypothetical protein
MAKEKKSADKKDVDSGRTAKPDKKPGQQPIVEIIQHPTGIVIIKMMKTPFDPPEINELYDVTDNELKEIIRTFEEKGYKVRVSKNKDADKNANSAKTVS